MKTLKKIVVTTLLLICPLFFLSSSFAQSLEIMTENYPPFNYTKDGKLTGLCTDVVREIMKKVGQPDNIKNLPWARAYNIIQNKNNMVLFSTTRTKDRENMFKWVGPLSPNKWVFYAKKGSGISISTLDDAKTVKRIGTYNDDAAEHFLENKGFTNLRSVSDDGLNAKMLVAGRVDLWITGEFQGIYKARQNNVDVTLLEIIYEVKETMLYIAFSKDTPDNVIDRWQKALDEIKADGTYDKIHVNYK